MNISATKFQQYADDPAKFRAELNIDVSGNICRWGEVMDPWQHDDFSELDPAVMYAIGRTDEKPYFNRAWLERPRGHSKTCDLAALCNYFLTFATRPVRGFFFAGDRDQASLPLDEMNRQIRLNPWQSKILEVQKGRIVNIASGHPGAGSVVEVYSSSVGTSFGILPDLILAEEITHWQDNAEALWHSLLSSAAKRSNCFLAAICNAGFLDSWQWAVREAARVGKHWFFSPLEGPQASWMTEQRLAEQRKMLPTIAYLRLWENKWSSGGGDALLPSDIEAAFIKELTPMTGRNPNFYYVLGCDLGLTRDCAAVVVLAVPKGGKSPKIRLAHNKLWRPVAGKKIDLMAIERHILELDEMFGLESLGFDPWQSEHLAQRLEADSNHRRRNQRIFLSQPWAREIPPTAANLREQASLTIESFQDGRFAFYTCEPLRRDLLKLRVEERSNGTSFRLVSPRSAAEGHGDTASAFTLALLLAHELAGKKPPFAGVTDFGHNRSFSTAELIAARQREYDMEQAFLDAPDPDPTGFLTALREGTARFSRPLT